MVKWSIHQEDRTILNLDTLNIGAHIMQALMNLEKQTTPYL